MVLIVLLEDQLLLELFDLLIGDCLEEVPQKDVVLQRVLEDPLLALVEGRQELRQLLDDHQQLVVPLDLLPVLGLIFLLREAQVLDLQLAIEVLVLRELPELALHQQVPLVGRQGLAEIGWNEEGCGGFIGELALDEVLELELLEGEDEGDGEGESVREEGALDHMRVLIEALADEILNVFLLLLVVHFLRHLGGIPLHLTRRLFGLLLLGELVLHHGGESVFDLVFSPVFLLGLHTILMFKLEWLFFHLELVAGEDLLQGLDGYRLHLLVLFPAFGGDLVFNLVVEDVLYLGAHLVQPSRVLVVLSLLHLLRHQLAQEQQQY
mmetsp:Transcript_13266/g.13061  ORF Transcript_13266/g.13061 Transcript_13266/m.13061 type:complete len:323 (-) Transcript_13266:379-1347(-)